MTHVFGRDGIYFRWDDGWMHATKNGETVMRSIDTHFESDDDVWEFYLLMREILPKRKNKPDGGWRE